MKLYQNCLKCSTPLNMMAARAKIEKELRMTNGSISK